MWEKDYNDIYNRLYNIFQNKIFIESISSAHDNWLEVSIEEATKVILDFFASLIPVSV